MLQEVYPEFPILTGDDACPEAGVTIRVPYNPVEKKSK